MSGLWVTNPTNITRGHQLVNSINHGTVINRHINSHSTTSDVVSLLSISIHCRSHLLVAISQGLLAIQLYHHLATHQEPYNPPLIAIYHPVIRGVLSMIFTANIIPPLSSGICQPCLITERHMKLFPLQKTQTGGYKIP